MNKLFRHAIAAGAMLMAAGASQATDADVYFTPVGQFADMPATAAERAEVLIELSKHFDKLAAKLPAGQQLRVVVLDLDLAGRNWHQHAGIRDLRIISNNTDWPQLKMTYTISENGKVIEEGQEYLKNMGFRTRANVYFTGDALRYEKQMLDDWFRQRIAAR